MSDWVLSYEGLDPAQERHRETLLTVGNGYTATRGSLAHVSASADHYPGTYAAGVYNALTSRVGSVDVTHESMVNLPTWLGMTFRAGEGPWLGSDGFEIATCNRRLDLASATLHTSLVVVDDGGRRTRIEERRFVDVDAVHLGVIEQTITAENWSGTLEVRATLDSDVRNANVLEDRLLAGQHLRSLEVGAGDDGVAWLTCETVTSHVRIAVAQRVTCDGAVLVRATEQTSSGHLVRTELRQGESARVGKTVAIYTSKDAAIADPLTSAIDDVRAAPDVDALHLVHARVWDRVWSRFAIELDEPADVVVRLQWYHLMVALGPSVHALDAGVPARGLHGEAYRGHVFWDELFVIPLLVTRYPDLARSLLLYRYRRLPAARRAARSDGRAGAHFPWQSGADGSELTPSMLFNHHSGRWMPDNSRRQLHVGLAIAWNVDLYVEATGDRRFLTEYGAELLVEIAQFFASCAARDPRTGRYHLRGVMGPDEFHDGPPDQPGAGVDDNAYTNVMVSWLLRTTLRILDGLSRDERADLCDRIGDLDDDVEQWTDMAAALFVPFHDGLLSQFAGYEQLAELDWDAYRERYGAIGRLDLILEAEGDTTNRYRASKQADVLMLFYLFSAEELTDLLHHLGYPFEPAAIPATIDYYLARCSDGSSLSRVVHAWVAARSGRAHSWSLLQDSLAVDLDDTQRGTTAEGVHLGAMAGSLDLLQRCYSGMELRADVLRFAPQLPDELDDLRFVVAYRGHAIWITVRPRQLVVVSVATAAAPVRVAIGEDVRELASGARLEFTYGGVASS